MKNFLLKLLLVCCVLSIAAPAGAQSNYEPYWFATLAGIFGLGGNADGLGRAARFNGPAGVAVDSAGNIYIADRQNYVIRKITPAGLVTTLAGPTQLDYPNGIAVDRLGNIYTTHLCAILKITPDGVVTTLAGERASCYTHDGTGSDARFDFPAKIAVDNGGNLYVTETDGCTLRKVTPAGVVTTLAGLPEVPGSADGTGSAARFQYPDGVAVDSAGYIYVADWGNSTIRKVTPTGDVTTFAGLAHAFGSNDGIGNAARFNQASGVAVDLLGNLYVTDGYNDTIRKITPAAVVTTLAGSPGQHGGADGTGNAARFFVPGGIAVDSAGTLFVVDGSWIIRVGGIPLTLSDAESLTISNMSPIRIALAGEPTIECRSGGTVGEQTLLFTFVRDISSVDVSVVAGIGSVSGNPSIFANQLRVNLTGVADEQTLTLALTNILDVQGQSLPNTNVTIGFLVGDTNNDALVNASDVTQTKASVGQTVDDSNLRSDVNADGIINALDVSFVKSKIGNGLVPSGLAIQKEGDGSK